MKSLARPPKRDALKKTPSMSSVGAASECPLLRGFLKKKGGFFGTYNKYWVVLENRVLSIFSNASDTTAAFVIPLEGASVVVADHLIGKKHSLAVFPSASQHQKNQYPGAPVHLLAENDVERDAWLAAMRDPHSKAPNGIISTIEAMLDSVVVSDAMGEIMAFNRAAEQMFGWAAQDIIGRNVSVLTPESIAIQHASYMENYSRTRQQNLIGKPRRVTAVRKNGSNIPVEISLGEMPPNQEGARFMAVFRDMAVVDEHSTESEHFSAHGTSHHSTQEMSESSRFNLEEHRRNVNGLLSRHENTTLKLVHRIQEESSFDSASDATDSDSLLDSDDDLSTHPEVVLSELEYEQHTRALHEHKKQMEKMVHVTKHLDKLIGGLVSEAKETAQTEFNSFLDSKLSQLAELQEMSKQSQQRIQEMEEKDRLLRAQLKTRTEGMMQLQRKLATLTRLQASGKPEAPAAAAGGGCPHLQQMPDFVPPIQLPLSPFVPAAKDDTRLELSSAKSTSDISVAVPESPLPTKRDEPLKPVPPSRPPLVMPAPRKEPIVLTSFAWEPEILSLHAEVTKLWSKPFIRTHVGSGRTIPDPKAAVVSSLLMFDISAIQDLNKFIESPFFTEMSGHDIKKCQKQAEEMKQLKTKVDQLNKKIKSMEAAHAKELQSLASQQPSGLTSSSPGPESTVALLNQIIEAERQFRRERAKANFHVAANRVKLKEIQEAILANRSGTRSQAIEDLLRRMEERRQRSLAKWERKKVEIIAQRDKALEKVLAYKSNLVVVPAPPPSGPPPATTPRSSMADGSRRASQSVTLVAPTSASMQRRQSVAISVATAQFGGMGAPTALATERRQSVFISPPADSLKTAVSLNVPSLERPKSNGSLLKGGGGSSSNLVPQAPPPPGKSIRFVRDKDSAHALVFD